MEHAEERGDRQRARALARTILASGERAIDSAAGEEVLAQAPDQSDAGEARNSALELLARTEPDAFLLVVGMLGLGLMVWLVYNYVL